MCSVQRHSSAGAVPLRRIRQSLKNGLFARRSNDSLDRRLRQLEYRLVGLGDCVKQKRLVKRHNVIGSETNDVLLARASAAELTPIRKRVETRGKGKLLLAGAVRIDQNELELTAFSDSPVEHDLLAIG